MRETTRQPVSEDLEAMLFGEHPSGVTVTFGNDGLYHCSAPGRGVFAFAEDLAGAGRAVDQVLAQVTR